MRILLLLSFLFLSFYLSSQKRIDKSKTIDKEGVICTKNNMKPFTGIISEHWSTGYSTTEYVNGLKHGAFCQYYTSGQLRSVYKYKNNKLNGISYDLSEKGDTVLVADKMVDNVLKGSYKSFYKNGSLNEVLIIEELTHITVGENGRVFFPKLFQRLKATGCVICYYENGQLEFKIAYLKGLVDGEAVAYHKNGTLKSKGYFKNGVITGTFSQYYENGLLDEEVFYDDSGKKIARLRLDEEGNGRKVEYSDEGNIVKIELYQNGKPVE